MGESDPVFENELGQSDGGMDMLPQPVGGRLPLLITGSSQQSMSWLGACGTGPDSVSAAASAVLLRETQWSVDS
jgi:hypothetical protein